MAHWIFVEEGTYVAEAAFLVTAGHTGVAVEDAVVEVYLDGNHERRVRGHAMMTNLLMVELLQDYDEIDLLLDLSEEFKYLLKSPIIKAGKVFSPDVKSLFYFIAQGPLEKLNIREYSSIRSALSLIEPP